jgi:hypothetical protein
MERYQGSKDNKIIEIRLNSEKIDEILRMYKKVFPESLFFSEDTMSRSPLFLMFIACLLCVRGTADAQSNPGRTGILSGEIVDSGTGKPIPARVYIIGQQDSIFIAEDGILYDRPAFAARIGYSGRHFTTRGNRFTANLPEGTYTVIVERGKEYTPARETVVISAGETLRRLFRLERWISLAERGWFSGDLHSHRPLRDMGDLLPAEDLNLAVPQTVWSSAVEPELDRWLNKADSRGVISVDATHVFSVLSHELERTQSSALFVHHTGKTVLPVEDIYRKGLPNSAFIAAGRAAGGLIEEEKPWWPESQVDIAVGKADLLGLANNHLTYRSYLPEHDRKRTEFRSDYPPGAMGYVLYVCDLYYACLNCGFRPMLSAGSASGVLPNPLGYNRVYVHCEKGFSYGAFIDGLKRGKSFATNGPMLFISLNGKDMGDSLQVNDKSTLHLVCEVHSQNPLDRLEILYNGKIVRSFAPDLSNHSAIIATDLTASETGWISARCFERREDTVRFAHTSPVFVTVGNAPFIPKRYAAEYFLEKTQELIASVAQRKFPDESTRRATLEYYREAEKIYSELVKRSRQGIEPERR